MAPISTLTVKLQAQIAEFQGEFREAQKDVQKFHDNFEATATKASAMGNLIAIGAEHAIRAIGNLGRELLENAGRIKDLSERTGLAVETIQRFQYVAEQTGTSVDAFSDAAFRLGANIAGGSQSVVNAVEALGLSFAELKTSSPDKQFEIVAEALGKMENAGERNRLGMILMERQFKQVAPAISEGYKKIADDAEAAGRRQIEAIDGVGDAISRFKSNSTAVLTNAFGSIVITFEQLESALDKFDAQFGGLRLLLPGNTAAVHGFADALSRVKKEANEIDLSEVVADMQRMALMKLKDTSGAAVTILQPGTADYRAVEEALSASIKRQNAEWDKAKAAAEAYRNAVKDLRDEFSGASLQAEVRKMEDAFRGLTLEQRNSPDVMRRVGEAADDLRQKGAALTPELLAAADAVTALNEASNFGQQGFNQFENVREWLPDFQKFVSELERMESLSNFGEQGFNQFENTREWQDIFEEFNKPSKWEERLGTFQDAMKKAGLRAAHTLAEGIAEGIRSGNWGAAGQAFEDAMGQMLSSGMANAVNFFVPGLGDALKPIFDAISEKITSAFDFNEGRDLVEDFAKSFGGFDALHARLLEMGDAGEALWKKLTQGVGRDNPEQARAVIAEVQAALEEFGTEAERAAARMDAIGLAMDGVNTKAQLFAAPFQALIDKQKEGKITQDEFTASLAALGEKGQAEFERIGIFAAAAFGGMVKETGDAIGALDRLAPALGVLKQGITEFGLTSTGTIDALIGLFDLVHDQTTGPILQAIQATGQIFAGLQDAGILTSDLFQTVATDIGAAFRELEAKGGDVSKAMALSQPVLQRLWEGQKLYGEITDETTRKLLQQAEEQGLVGDHMKDVNQRILDVLILIGEVLGADIPDALRGVREASSTTASSIEDNFRNAGRSIEENFRRAGRSAAESIENEFKGIKIPPIKVPVEIEGGDNLPRLEPGVPLPRFGSGGVVTSPMLALVGDVPEAIIPLNQLHSVVPEAGSTTVVLQMDGRDMAEVVVPHIPGVARRYITV